MLVPSEQRANCSARKKSLLFLGIETNWIAST